MHGAIAAIPGVCVDEGDNDSTDAVFGDDTDTDVAVGLTDTEEEDDSASENNGNGKFVGWGHMKPDGTYCLKTNGEYCTEPEAKGANNAMPPFWQRHISDEHGATYFWNSNTKESRWIRPTA